MQSDFTRQGIAKCGSPLDVTEGNYAQKNTRMLALTTDHFESHKAHCTRTKEEISCVKIHIGRLIAEMRDVTAKNTTIEELTRATKRAVREEAAATRGSTKDRLQSIKRQVSELIRVAAATQTQMNKISCNLSNVMTLIAAGTSRGNELIRDLLTQNTTVVNGNWTYEKIAEDGSVQKSDACDVRHTQRETKEFYLFELSLTPHQEQPITQMSIALTQNKGISIFKQKKKKGKPTNKKTLQLPGEQAT
jgi:hypothetical protein